MSAADGTPETLHLEPHMGKQAELHMEPSGGVHVVAEGALVEAHVANRSRNNELGDEGIVTSANLESLAPVESSSNAVGAISTASLASMGQSEGVEYAADQSGTKAMACTEKIGSGILPLCDTDAASKSFETARPVNTVVSKTETPLQIEHEREEFTGLRIVKRCIPATQWSQEIRGKNRRIVPFSRFNTELADRRRDHDCVVIGVLYECVNSDKFANGECFARWGLTDLADPKPRRLVLHLRYQAFSHWRTNSNAASACRGSIFAIMNPVMVEQCVGRAGDTETIARVEKAAQLLKLGECPSLGKCAEKHCNLPCNARWGNRFCARHLSEAYAEKLGRIVACGGTDTTTASLLRDRRSAKPRSQTVPMAEPEEENDNNVKDAKKIKTKLALQLDDRRFNHSDSKEDYVRSICRGVRPDSKTTSRVPVLARGLEGPDTIELDLASIESSEKRKAERMLEQRAERVMRKTSESDVVDIVPYTSKLAAKRQETTRKRSLGELVQALSSRRTMRRTDVIDRAGHDSSIVSTADGIDNLDKAGNASTASSSSVTSIHSKLGHPITPLTVPSPQGLVALPPKATSDSVAHAQTLLRDLAVAGDDVVRIKAILQEVDNLPGVVLCENVGRMLYAAIGCLTQHSDHGDIKRLALSTRRRLRAASDIANQEAAGAAAPIRPSSESAQAETNVGAEIVPIPSAESEAPNNGLADGRVTGHWVAEGGDMAVSVAAADSEAVCGSAVEKKFVATHSCLGVANSSEGDPLLDQSPC